MAGCFGIGGEGAVIRERDSALKRQATGLDVAGEALTRYLPQGDVQLETLQAMARVNLVERIMRLYLEAPLSETLPSNNTG